MAETAQAEAPTEPQARHVIYCGGKPSLLLEQTANAH